MIFSFQRVTRHEGKAIDISYPPAVSTSNFLVVVSLIVASLLGSSSNKCSTANQSYGMSVAGGQTWWTYNPTSMLFDHCDLQRACRMVGRNSASLSVLQSRPASWLRGIGPCTVSALLGIPQGLDGFAARFFGRMVMSVTGSFESLLTPPCPTVLLC